MNVDKFLTIIVFICLFQSLPIHSQDLSDLTLIAHYPLTSSANDTTGNYEPMTLINTPFQDGGIYCNGISSSCDAFTPSISNLNFEALAVSAKFKASSYHTAGFNPVFICGRHWRWMGIGLLPDSLIGYIFNYSSSQYTDLKFSLDTWHLATVTYDSSTSVGKYYIDGVLADSALFQLVHGNDKTFTITHGGQGHVFHGIFSDLKIYTKQEATKVESDKDEIPKQYQLSQNYPNPFNPITIISYTVPRSDFITLRIYNSIGKEIQTLVNQHQKADTYNISFDASDLSSGIYFYRLNIGKHFVETRKMLLIR